MNFVSNLAFHYILRRGQVGVYLQYTLNDMAYSKSEQFSNGEQQTAVIAKSLAHPARVAILKVLAKYQSCLCGEIVAELPLSQSTVSQHLKELRSSGLIKAKQEGPAVVYSIDMDALKKAEKRVNKLFRKVRANMSK